MTVRQDAPEVQTDESSCLNSKSATSAPGSDEPGGPGTDREPPSERQIAQWLALFLDDGQVFELRAPRAARPGGKGTENPVRRFRSAETAEAARQAHRLSARAPGVYF